MVPPATCSSRAALTKGGDTLRQHETDSKPGIFRFGRRPAILFSTIAVLILATPVAADAAKVEPGAPKVTVMTRNVFLGADLGPALDATTLDGAIDGRGVTLNEVAETNFPERAKPLAKEIAESGADLVGLQEVALWRQQIPSDLAPGFGGTPGAGGPHGFA